MATLPGSGGGPSLLLLGHADVVSAGEGWTVDPFGADRRDGAIYGRGTADMKGRADRVPSRRSKSCVAADVRLRGDVLLASVVDEEAGGMGTLAVVDRGYRADGAIIPEPTDLNVAPLCRGIVWGRLTIPGRASHIEMPQPHWRDGGAVDAIALGRVFLDAIDRLNARWAANPAKRHPLLPLPCQVNVSMLDAGEFPTAYASRMRITFDAQYLPAERDERGLGGRVKAELEAVLRRDRPGRRMAARAPAADRVAVDADCGGNPGRPSADPVGPRRGAGCRRGEPRGGDVEPHRHGAARQRRHPDGELRPRRAERRPSAGRARDRARSAAGDATLALAIAEWCGWDETETQESAA